MNFSGFLKNFSGILTRNEYKWNPKKNISGILIRISGNQNMNFSVILKRISVES